MVDAPAFDPSKPFEPVGGAAPPFDPSKPFEPVSTSEQSSTLSSLASPITDVPHEIYQAGKSALSTIGSALNPFSEERHVAYAKQAAAPSFGEGLTQGVQQTMDTGKGLMAIPELAAAPISGAARSMIGHPYSVISGKPYEQAKQDVDLAMMGLAPGRGGLSTLRSPGMPPPMPSSGPLGVTLSEGQETGALPAIRAEQAAARGQLGPSAEAQATDFLGQQKNQLEAAKKGVMGGLDQFGQTVAESPQAAGQFVSNAMQQAAAAKKASVDRAYKFAQGLPGEIHSAAFESMPQKIKGDLTFLPEPVIVDQATTPNALKMIDYLESKIGNLKIQNAADPFGPPNPENITGVNLKGVDQWRKALSGFRQDAYGNSASDARAARAVMAAFDNRIDEAVNGGLFNGDPRAIQAWNDARAMHSDYKGTFSAQKNDPIGRVVEKILGKQNNPAAIPNDVADFLYGSSGVNPSSLNVGVANRVKSVLGDSSPEWSAVRQGLFSRLVEPPPGMLDWGPQKISERLNRFLNGDGKELARTILTAPQRDLIQQYADLQRKLVIPTGGVNRSETSTFVAPILRKISGGLAALVGAAVGHAVAPGLYGVGEITGAATLGKASALFENARNARQIAKQMPLVADAMAKYQKALTAYNKANSPLSNTALTVATANLGRAIRPLGLNLESLMGAQGTVPAAANQQQTQ